jgi:hypothetical protein
MESSRATTRDEAAKMGMLASHEPRMKKQVMANQHIVIITPH